MAVAAQLTVQVLRAIPERTFETAAEPHAHVVDFN